MQSGTRERLVEVAGRLFARNGFNGVSVRDIVREAEANLGAVTYHFGSKEALFAEIVARKLARLQEIGQGIAGTDKGPEEKLRAILMAYAFHVLHDDPGLRVLISEMVTGGDRLPQAAIDSVTWRNRMFVSIVEEGIAGGEFRECDVEVAAWSFFGMLTAYILYKPLQEAADEQGAYPREYVRRVVEAALDLFMNGLRRREET